MQASFIEFVLGLMTQADQIIDVGAEPFEPSPVPPEQAKVRILPAPVRS